MGVATSSATFFRQMGSTMGVALLGTVFGAVLASSMATHLAEATRDVPAEWRRQFVPPSGAGGQAGGEGAVGGQMFDAAVLKVRLAGDFDRRREALTRAADAGDAQARGQLEGLAEARKSAESTVDRVALAFKTAFTEAIRFLYLVALFIAGLAFLVIFALPELPLRKSNAPPPSALD
jgi:hypothetical protein